MFYFMAYEVETLCQHKFVWPKALLYHPHSPTQKKTSCPYVLSSVCLSVCLSLLPSTTKCLWFWGFREHNMDFTILAYDCVVGNMLDSIFYQYQNVW